MKHRPLNYWKSRAIQAMASNDVNLALYMLMACAYTLLADGQTDKAYRYDEGINNILNNI